MHLISVNSSGHLPSPLLHKNHGSILLWGSTATTIAKTADRRPQPPSLGGGYSLVSLRELVGLRTPYRTKAAEDLEIVAVA